MFKTVAKLTVLLAVLAFAPLASAAPAAPAEEKAGPGVSHIGIGIGINTFSIAGAQLAGGAQPGADIYVPLELGALRLEPSLGISRWSQDNNGGDASSVNLGCGVLVPLRPGKIVNVYVGGRLFLNFVSESVPVGAGATTSDSGVDFTLAGVLGAEWYADPHFSIGAEARLGYTAGSSLSSSAGTIRSGYSQFNTSGVVMFRFYL
jgi:hypothetical protein